ncbi:MAG: hypothetical protein U0904_11085 [Candidatus Nanopelagicales bacterium]|nr:hypothetical protein [Candidatus Nanopelagicales bacterium]
MSVNQGQNPYDVVRNITTGNLAALAADAQLRLLVNYALLSPSPHNTQPWSWQQSGRTVRLLADQSRLLAVSDPDARELEIGCGSALEHLLMAMAAHGIQGQASLASDHEPEELATVTLGTGEPQWCAPAGMTAARLVDAMLTRRTNRMSFADPGVPDELLEALSGDAAAYDVLLHSVTPQESPELIRLIMEGDKAQMADREFRHELAHWMRPAGTKALDGMSADLLGQKGVAAKIAPLVVRTFDMGRSQAAKDEELTGGSPTLLVIGTREDNKASHMMCGQYLARFLLTLEAHDLAAAYMNQPCEVPELRGDVGSLVDQQHPQLIIRVGHAPARPHESVRRPLDDVLV